jgi:two-component system response regulator HydG
METGMASSNVRILIADDDQDLAESLADLLRFHGYDVDLAKDGQDALQRSLAADHDITFMDVRMPVMNGVDSFLAIRKVKPHSRVVMMTGFREAILQQAIDAGAEGPLSKPFPVGDILKLIEDGRLPGSSNNGA